MDNFFDRYKCPLCKGTLRVHEKLIDMGGFRLPSKRLVCNRCNIRGGYVDACIDEQKERQLIYLNFIKAVESRKFNNARKPEKILSDIRNYLVAIIDEWHNRIDEPNFYEQNIGVYNHIQKELDDLAEYAKNLGVELQVL
jgi:hypothetical protein